MLIPCQKILYSGLINISKEFLCNDTNVWAHLHPEVFYRLSSCKYQKFFFFLQMPRPLCNFLSVYYFLQSQVCNKTICVKKKKKKRRKEKVFTNLLLTFIYSSELILNKPPINAPAWCNHRLFLFCTSCRCSKQLPNGKVGYCTDTPQLLLVRTGTDRQSTGPPSVTECVWC